MIKKTDQAELIRQFEILEKEVIGDGVHEKLHILPEEFSRRLKKFNGLIGLPGILDFFCR